MLGINADVFISNYPNNIIYRTIILILYLVDFGLCCHSSKQKRGPVGSPYWMPPEMLNHTLQTTAVIIFKYNLFF